MRAFSRYLATIALILTLCGGTGHFAYAQDEIGDQIVAFLKETGNQEVEAAESVHLSDPSVILMRETFEAAVTSDAERLVIALANIDTSYPNSPQATDIRELAEVINQSLKNDSETGDSPQMIALLEPYLDHEDWYLQSIAASLQAFMHFTQSNLLLAAENAENAMAIIPTELSIQAIDARLRASEIMMALHGVQGNPDFMLDAAKILTETKAELGEKVNRYELMTNFVFVLNRVRNFEDAAKVAQLLLEEERPDDAVPGLSETYMAETFNELANYQLALTLSEAAVRDSQHPVIQGRASNAQIVALAGLGQERSAHDIMDERGLDYSLNSLLTGSENDDVIHAEALLAMHRGETELALTLMKRRADLLVEEVQSANSSDMSSLLSNLENTRGRQAERESALQREAELRAEQLKQRTRVNRMLWILIGVLTLAFNFLLLFLRYRMKLSGKVQGLQKDALSAEKMKTEFLGVINHELRTPLNGIIGISDAMIHHADDPALKKQAEAVQESGQVLFNLLDSLITMSTIEGNRLSLEPDETDLSKTLAREVAEWKVPAENKGLSYSSHIGPELQTPLIVDEKRLRRCVGYLLSNAVRFTQEGRVHLHATGEKDDQGQMQIRIIVADTGQGMNTDVQSRLFKPFLQADAYMTRKYGGAGLSLAIARKLARMMEGDLTVTSREGRGSEFVLTAKLPLALQKPEGADDAALQRISDAKQAAQRATSRQAKSDFVDLMERQDKSSPVTADLSSPVSVLLADPGGLPSQTLREALQEMNGRVVEASSHRDIISLLDTDDFDAVLVNLAQRNLDLEKLAFHIRHMEKACRDIPIIAIAEREEKSLKQRLKTAGVDHILSLPLSPESLARALQDRRQVQAA